MAKINNAKITSQKKARRSQRRTLMNQQILLIVTCKQAIQSLSV
jgi:hypothetical protein